MLLASCGMDHEVDGGTDNNINVDIKASVCEDERFNAEQKLECIKALFKVNIDSDLTPEDIEILKQIIENYEASSD